MPLRREATIYSVRNPISAAETGKSHCDTGHTLCPDIRQWRHRHDTIWLRRRGSISFVDDLDLGRGAVLSWAVLSLRSIEAKPFDGEICPLWSGIFLTLNTLKKTYRHIIIPLYSGLRRDEKIKSRLSWLWLDLMTRFAYVRIGCHSCVLSPIIFFKGKIGGVINKRGLES